MAEDSEIMKTDSQSLKIRDATLGDTEQILEVHARSIREVCSADYTSEQISAWSNLTAKGYHKPISKGGFWVAEVNGKVVGFSEIIPADNEVRAGFPESIFQRLATEKLVCGNEKAVDLGTGTGTLARGLAKAGCDVIGIVPSVEKLIEKFNPEWAMGGGNGIYPQWFQHMGDAGFQEIRSFSYDEDARYSHEGWRGRIRASAGVAASLPPEKVEMFDAELARVLENLL